MAELDAGTIRVGLDRMTPGLQVIRRACHSHAIQIELSPHRSLAGPALRNCVSFTCALILAPSLLCCLVGLWGVLPFALLEIALFAFVLRRNWQQAHDREFITIDAAHILISWRERRSERAVELDRYWSRVRLSAQAEVRVESRGRSFAIGSFLTDTERCELAAHLRTLVGRIGELPSLPFEADSVPLAPN
jgi:uncharacterized membrane protein